MNILIVTNDETITTQFGDYYSNIIYNYIYNRGYTPIKIKNPVLKQLYKALKTYNPKLIIFWGVHGGTKSILTNNDNVTVGIESYDEAISTKIYGRNTHWFRNKIIYALSCWSGRELGRELVRDGAKAFIGYENPFFFIASSTNVLYDESSKPFFEANIIGIKRLVDGYTINQVYNSIREYMIKKAVEYKNIDEDISKYLLYDAKSLVAYGELNTRLK